MANAPSRSSASRGKAKAAKAKPKAAAKSKPAAKPKAAAKAKVPARKAAAAKPKPSSKPKSPAARSKSAAKAKPSAKPAASKVRSKLKRPAVKAKATSKPKPAPKPKPAAAKAKPAAKAKGSAPKAVKPAAEKAQTPPAAAKAAPAAPKPVVKPPRKLKRVHFDAKTLASITQRLEADREDLMAQLKGIEENAFASTQSEWSGETGYDEDYADAGTATFERERDLSIANNVQDLLDKINKALSKIQEGTYGLCESCGEPISAERLKALPYVLLCIRCKTREERR